MVSLFGRGKKLKCPDCGEIFKAPNFDEKSIGFGPAPPYMRHLTCLKCGAKRSRRDYATVQEPGDTEAARA